MRRLARPGVQEEPPSRGAFFMLGDHQLALDRVQPAVAIQGDGEHHEPPTLEERS